MARCARTSSAEEILQLRVARVARADAHASARAAPDRPRARAGASCGNGLPSAIVHPMRAEIERHAEQRVSVTQRPPMRLLASNSANAALGGGDAARGGDAGGAGADDDHVDVGVCRPARKRGRRQRGGGSGEKRAAAKPRHGIRILDAAAVRLPEAARRRKFHG